VGLEKKEYLVDELGLGTVELMKMIKRAIDPLGLFNPGKVFGFTCSCLQLDKLCHNSYTQTPKDEGRMNNKFPQVDFLHAHTSFQYIVCCQGHGYTTNKNKGDSGVKWQRWQEPEIRFSSCQPESLAGLAESQQHPMLVSVMQDLWFSQ